jgi:D-alanyl-D-alanine carboxypeptidase
VASNAFFPARAKFARFLISLLLALTLAVVGSVPAQAIANLRKYAGIVLDAKTGQTLYEAHADELRYPASISKVMTLYILFQELNAGHLTLNSMLTVSDWAASASPTKLGLRPGSRIRVEDAIKSIVTISANDMARTIAENISGSEPAFARRMTATARALGMRSTSYVNASGLPDGRQLTTVRDQAILASAIYEDFPQYYHYFQTRSFAYGKRVYGSHDYVLGFMGADGLKTGYINASGYNLMTATRIGGRHVVIVGFGFDSGGARDAMVRSLMTKYVPQARQGTYLASAVIRAPGRVTAPTVVLASVSPTDAVPAPAAVAPLVLPLPAPDFRQDDQAMPTPVAYAPEPMAYPDSNNADDASDTTARPAVAAISAMSAPTSRQNGAQTDVVGQSLSNMLLGAPPAALGQTRASAPLIPPVGIGAGNEPTDPRTSGSIQGQQVAEATLAAASQLSTAPVTPAGSWIVQIGAASSQDEAGKMLAKATGKISQLNDLRPYVELFAKDGTTYYRARFIGFGDERAATDMCGQLKKAKMSCLAMQS